MIVVDASAILEVLLNTPQAERVSNRILDPRESLHAPHLLDLEVAQVLRRYGAAGDLSADRATLALEDLAAFPIRRYPHDMLMRRIWELRKNVTAYEETTPATFGPRHAPWVAAFHASCSNGRVLPD